MPRIRLTRSGLNVNDAIRVRGEEVDVHRDVAAYLVESGQAVPVRTTTIETTTAGPAEATARRRTRRSREV